MKQSKIIHSTNENGDIKEKKMIELRKNTIQLHCHIRSMYPYVTTLHVLIYVTLHVYRLRGLNDYERSLTP